MKTKAEQLNSNPVYREIKCILCGRKYPNTVIDIEAVIHHGNKPMCFDQKSCKKFRKKNK